MNKIRTNPTNSCDLEVKKIVSLYNHRKCTPKNIYTNCVKITGSKLNSWLILKGFDAKSKPYPFINSKDYSICSNFKRLLDSVTLIPLPVPESPKNTPSLGTDERISNNNIPIIVPPPLTRQERYLLRNRIPVRSLKGIKTVRLAIKGDDDRVIDMTSRRKSTVRKFRDDLLGKCGPNYFKVRFGKLKMRTRRHRMKSVSQLILGACIDRKEYKVRDKEYLISNEALAVDVINLISGVKEFLESKLEVNFDTLENVAMQPIEDDNDGLIHELNINKKEHRLAINILGETSANGYGRMKYNMQEFVDLPSYHVLSKKRPKVKGFIVPIVNIESYEIELDENDTSDVVKEPTVLESTVFKTEEEELESKLREFSNDSDMLCAKIDGNYSNYLSIIEDKHVKHGRIISSTDNAIVIDSFDGAEHLKSKKSITSVISFSTTILNSSWLANKQVSACSSMNILTWQQLKGVESAGSIMPAVKDYFISKEHNRRNVFKGRENYFYYDLHDGKMLYLLMQHSLWNRKISPFLLCKCGRGEGVINEDHECTLISNDEQLKLYNRSQKRWTLKRKALEESNGGSKESYTVKKHMDWVDENTFGVSHFGVSPDLLPRDGLRMDMFHLKCAVTRRLMSNLRDFILQQSSEIINSFGKTVLQSFWNDFHWYVWKNKKSFASFLGNELALFVGNVDKVTAFIDAKFIPTTRTTDICNGLKLWRQLFRFMGITAIQPSEEHMYLQQLTDFEVMLKEFYSIGKRTFLSKPGKTGVRETFYAHSLRFYIPKIAKTTFERHRCGVGIFSMQGFERRNKESKTCMRRFSNNKGNVVVNNIKRLHDVFEHDINTY